MLKKILFTVMSIFLIWQSYKLIFGIHHMETDNLGIVIFVGWIINMFITGIFAFMVFAYPAQRLLPKTYYHIYEPKQLTKWCKRLKMDWFRKFLLLTFWRNKERQKGYFDGTIKGMENLIMQSQKSEFGHVLPLIIIDLVCIYLFAIGMYKLAIATILFNVLGNFYPILLQRHHRMRIQRIKARLKTRQT